MQECDVTDVSLLRRIKAYVSDDSSGEARRELDAAWIRFYRVYSMLIQRYARRCGVPPADVDDCVQEVWAEVLVALRSFRYDPRRGRFRAWLFTLVRSKATDSGTFRERRHSKQSGWEWTATIGCVIGCCWKPNTASRSPLSTTSMAVVRIALPLRSLPALPKMPRASWNDVTKVVRSHRHFGASKSVPVDAQTTREFVTREFVLCGRND